MTHKKIMGRLFVIDNYKKTWKENLPVVS